MLNISDIMQFFDYKISSCISQLIISELRELQKPHSPILREQPLLFLCFNITFYYLNFISQTLTIHRTVSEEGGHLFSSYIPIPTASWKLRHQSGNYCREFISALRHQLEPNREPLFFQAEVAKH